MKTEVCITIDVEYSIAGAFAAPDRYKPLGDEVVQCLVGGREQGLGFILDGLARRNLIGTFFTEALQTAYFGPEPMGRIARRIFEAGHDVQLHLHPSWLQFRDDRWRQPGFKPNDACAGRTDAELDEMLRLGQETFAQWGIPQPLALRTGSLCTDRAVFRAMARAGMTLASNIGLGIFAPAEPALQLWGGRHLLEGVLEAPVLSYRTPDFRRWGAGNWRALAITATSKAEIEKLLWQAREAQAQSVVILTHPHEFVTRKSFRYDDLGINHVNQGRFLHLVDFLHTHRSEFDVVSMGERRANWHQNGSVQDPALQTSWMLAALRMAQNIANDVI